MLKWKTQADKDSLYNTPPTYSIYMAMLVFRWLKKLGGITEIEKQNRYKAGLLYDYLDSSDFYRTAVKKRNSALL